MAVIRARRAAVTVTVTMAVAVAMSAITVSLVLLLFVGRVDLDLCLVTCSASCGVWRFRLDDHRLSLVIFTTVGRSCALLLLVFIAAFFQV